MATILVTTMPFAGHVRPGLPLARELVARGHDVVWYTGRKYASLVTATGAAFVPFAPEFDFDDADVDARRGLDGATEAVGPPAKAGLKDLRRDIREVFLKPVVAQVADLERIVAEVRPDVIVTEISLVAGAFAAERLGVPLVSFPISPVGLSSVDTAPFGAGVLPGTGSLGRLRNRLLTAAVRFAFRPEQALAESIRATLGLRPLRGSFMDWSAEISDCYVAPTVPDFEYPRSDLPANVEFVGAFLPHGVDGDWVRPAWWPELAAARAAGRKVVLVTQGTLATDPRNLLLPTVEAMVGQDVLLIAVTGGPDPDEVLPPVLRPANLRLERFIPFTELLPLVDVTVTNGGYGGVQLSLAHGVPLVVAGTTEDKAEVTARVVWSGSGVGLKSDRPAPRVIRDAVRTVLGAGRYADSARRLQEAYARYPGVPRAAEIVLGLAGRTSGTDDALVTGAGVGAATAR